MLRLVTKFLKNSKSQLHLLLLHSLIKIANILLWKNKLFNSFKCLPFFSSYSSPSPPPHPSLSLFLPRSLNSSVFAKDICIELSRLCRYFPSCFHHKCLLSFRLLTILPANDDDDDDKREENNIKCANKTQHKGKLVEWNFQNSSAAAR